MRKVITTERMACSIFSTGAMSLPHSSLCLSHLLTEVAEAGCEAVPPHERLQHNLRRLMQLFSQSTNLEEAYPLFRDIMLLS